MFVLPHHLYQQRFNLDQGQQTVAVFQVMAANTVGNCGEEAAYSLLAPHPNLSQSPRISLLFSKSEELWLESFLLSHRDPPTTAFYKLGLSNLLYDFSTLFS